LTCFIFCRINGLWICETYRHVCMYVCPDCDLLWLCTATQICGIVPQNIASKTGENRNTGMKTCPIATLSTTNSTLTDLGLSPGLCVRLVTSYLRHVIACKVLLSNLGCKQSCARFYQNRPQSVYFL
jgi:flagellar biosynthesis protein FliP